MPGTGLSPVAEPTALGPRDETDLRGGGLSAGARDFGDGQPGPDGGPGHNEEDPQDEHGERQNNAEQNLNEAFLDSVSILEAWTKLRGTLESAIDVTRISEAEKYKGALSSLDQMFATLKASPEIYDGVEAVLGDAGFEDAEGACEILYAGYKDRIRSVLLVMQNVADDHLFDHSGEAGASVFSTEGAADVLKLVLDINEQYKAASSQTIADRDRSPIGRTLRTPFDEFAAGVMGGLEDTRENSGLLEHLRVLRSEYASVIQETIKKTGLYPPEQKPWERRAANPSLKLTPEELVGRERVAIDERTREFYHARFMQDMQVLHDRIDARIAAEEDPVINSWGYESGPEGRKQKIEERRFFGGKRTREVTLPQNVHTFDRRVRVPEYRDGELSSTLKPVKVVGLSVWTVALMGAGGLEYGQAGANLRYVANEDRMMEGLMMDSSVSAQEMAWRLEAQILQERGGEIYHMIPIVRDGKPCLLPLSDKQYKDWRGAVNATLAQFENIGLDYVSTKQQRERDALDVEHGLDNFSVPEVSRTWFNLHLQDMAMQDVFEDMVVPVNRQEEFSGIRNEILAAYSLFISRYGQQHEYAAMARRVVESWGRSPSDSEYDQLYAFELSRIISEYESMARMLSGLSSSEYDALSIFADFPEILETEPGWNSFLGVRSRYDTFINMANEGNYYYEDREEEEWDDYDYDEDTFAPPQGGAFAADGDGAPSSDTYTRNPDDSWVMPDTVEVGSSYDQAAVDEVVEGIKDLRKQGDDWATIKKKMARKYHPDLNAQDPSHGRAYWEDRFKTVQAAVDAIARAVNRENNNEDMSGFGRPKPANPRAN